MTEIVERFRLISIPPQYIRCTVKSLFFFYTGITIVRLRLTEWFSLNEVIEYPVPELWSQLFRYRLGMG